MVVSRIDVKTFSSSRKGSKAPIGPLSLDCGLMLEVVSPRFERGFDLLYVANSRRLA